MSLHTPAYLLFLLVITLVYWGIPGAHRRKLLLLAASFIFYALFDWRFLLLLLGLILFAYWVGWRIFRGPGKKAWAVCGVALVLGLLVLFKYANFFLDSLTGAPDALQLLLPVGISFFTFQAISYLLEIYRGKLPPAGSLVDLALYLAFFPKLIAGPLVRPRQFLEGVNRLPVKPDGAVLRAGFLRVLLGLFKKVLIADSLAGMADAAFRAASLPDGAGYPTPLFIQGFYLYAIQIYADFSGYTDIARGSAALFGFTLPENFQQPYLSTRLTAFWNCWHMSLTQWFREYLYFPIVRAWLIRTGRRWPRLIQAAANLVTMTLIGLWHGASWTFVAWGSYHGLLLTLETLVGWKPQKTWQRWIGQFVTFHLVACGWILFRSSSFTAAGRFFQGLFSFQQMDWAGAYLPAIFLPAVLILFIDLFEHKDIPNGEQFLLRYRPVLVIAAGIALLALALLGFARGGMAQPFIYGQF